MATWARITAGLGFLLLLAAFVLRLRLLFAGTAVIAEGEPFRGQLDEYDEGSLVHDPSLDPPEVSFVPTELEADQGDQGELLGITAHVRVPDADGREHTFSDTDHLELGDATVRVWRINVAPVLRLRAAGAAESVTVVPKLQLWRRDKREDRFRLPDDSGTLYVRLFPDFYEGPRGPETRSMALRNPVLQVRLAPDDANTPRGIARLRPGELHRFGALDIELVELRHWGAVEVSERRRHRVAYAGLLLLGLGLAGQLVAWVRRRRSA